jgi:SPP1 gp7 family putative phage head morphogenesis protein
MAITTLKRPKSKRLIRDPTQSKRIDDAMIKAMAKIINAYISDILAAVETQWGAALAERELSALSELMASTLQIPPETMQMVAAEFTEKGYVQGIMFANQQMEQMGLQIQIGMGPADSGMMDVLRDRSKLHLTNLAADLQAKIGTILTDGIAQGKSLTEIREDIIQAGEVAKRRAELIARTEIMNAVNEAAKERYKRLGITHFEWITARDERVCAKCEPLDGQVYLEKNLPEGGPPLHPQCRCALNPAFKDEKPLNIWDYKL